MHVYIYIYMYHVKQSWALSFSAMPLLRVTLIFSGRVGGSGGGVERAAKSQATPLPLESFGVWETPLNPKTLNPKP